MSDYPSSPPAGGRRTSSASASASAAVTPALSKTRTTRTTTSPATAAAAATAAWKNAAAVKKKGKGRRGGGANKKSITSKTGNNNDDNDNDNDNDMVDLTAISSSDEEDNVQNMKMPAKWKCPRCTSFNNNCASICIACDYNPIEDDNDNNDTLWKCSHCTLNNPNTLSECDACGQSSPVATAAAAAAASSSINDANDNDDVMDEDQHTTIMVSSSPSTASTKKNKRKKSDVTTATANTNTKRIKRESSASANASASTNDVAAAAADDDDDDDDDDVVVSAVVKSRTTTTNRDRRDRRNNNRKSAPPRINTTTAAATAASATNTDDDDDDDDDDVVLEAVINGMKLPHSREDCIENTFSSIDTTASNNKAFKGSKTTLLSSKKNNNNVCDCCYCYVCDSPAKDCKKWYSSSSNSAINNHCCARAKIEPWKSLREKHKAEADAKAARAVAAAMAVATPTAAAAGAAAGANTTTARPSTPRAPVGWHFLNKCRRFPRGTKSIDFCGRCWCYVCDSEGSSCRNRCSHVIADHTMLIWRQQREMIENKLTIEFQSTYGEKGPFEPDDNSALQDSILDKSLIQCRHCKWFMRFGKPPRRHHHFGPALDDCMTQRINSISNADWCLKCGLVASENDLEKDQAGPIPTDVGVGGHSNGSNNNDLKRPPNAPGTSVQQQAVATTTTQSSSPYLLGTKEIAFTIKAHDPRKMDEYKGNWKEYAKDGGWVYNLAKQKEEVFLHRIGKNPRLKNLLERVAIVSPAHIPTDVPPKEDDYDIYARCYTHGTPATIDDTDAIIIKDQQHLQLLSLLRHLEERQGITNLEVSWDASHSSGTITLKLYLPRTVFVLSTGGSLGFNTHHGINTQTMIQPAIISLWFGIKFSAGGLCGSLKLSPSPKVKYDTSNSNKLKVPSKLQTIAIDSNLLKKSENRLKKGHKQIETDIENVSLQEAQSLTTSYNGPQRYLYHGGMVVNDTSLMRNMTRYFREMFPQMIDSFRSDEIMLSIHHGHQISNHRSDNTNHLILDALIGVKDAVVARTGFSEDTNDALIYKHNKLAYQDRVAQTVVCFESLGHAAEDHVDGLEIELLEFQKQALKWALEREQMPGGIQSFFWPKVSDDLSLYYNPILHQFREDPPAVVRGGFLAQEMGLGKTVISLALILKNPAPANPPSGSPISMLETAIPPRVAAAVAAATAGSNNDVEIGWNKDLYKNTSGINKKRGSILCGGTLVICPVSLVGQWIEEARSKLSDPGLVYPYHGQGRLRNPDILSKNSIVVTTYNVVASDAFYHSAKGGANYCPPLEMIRWWRIIADEGHCLKESQTNIWKSCSQIVSDHKWIVTGTPLSTKVFDVKNQLAFLGIEHVNKIMQLCGTTSSGGRSYAANRVVPEHIMYLLKPIVLRHAQNQKYSGTETTLMSLPPKKERTHFIDFDVEEKEEFDIIEKKAQQFYLNFRAQHASTMSKYFFKVSQKLTPLRVACSGGKYPLEDEKKNNDDDTDMEDDDSDDEDQKKKKKKPAVKIYSEFAFKSKFRFLLQELESIRDNHISSKSLVFSQFNSTLEFLQIELPKHGFQFRTLSGSMSMKQRAKALRDFQNDPPTTVFLLSMRAGAVGINLTQANRVFLMEPSFNPALEAQAIGRVHRLGQKREVNILRLVIKNSFEDRMMKFLRKKYHHNDHKKTAGDGGDGNDDGDGNVDDDDDDDHGDAVSSLEPKQLQSDNTKDVPQELKGIVDSRLYGDDDNNNNGGGSDEDRDRSDGEGDSTEEEEKKDDNNDGNEIGLVGNIFREKAEIMTEEFDLLFGVDSIVKQQTEDGVAPDQIGSAEDGGTAPDHTASSFAPDHVLS